MAPRLVLHTRVVRGAGGGPEKTILTSPRYLGDAGYKMLCAYMRDPRDPRFGEIEQRARRLGASLVPVDDHGPLDWRIVGRFRDLCRECRPVIWHGHDYKSNLLGLLVRRSHPMRLVTTVHGWVLRSWKARIYHAIDRACLRRYDEVVCVSPDLYDRCRAAGVEEARCTLVPNAIDTEEFRRRETVEEAKSRQGVPPGRLLIGAVGRLSEEKGFPLLIEALERLRREGIDVELRIAGEGPQRPELEKLGAALGLGDRLRLLGYLPDPRDFYHSMDVFALSSLREGLPNVLLEAMALAVPVVATRVGGVPELVRDGENGVLVEPRSVEALTAGLHGLLVDPDRRRRLGLRGRRHVEERHGFDRRMETIRSIYDRALGWEGVT